MVGVEPFFKTVTAGKGRLVGANSIGGTSATDTVEGKTRSRVFKKRLHTDRPKAVGHKGWRVFCTTAFDSGGSTRKTSAIQTEGAALLAIPLAPAPRNPCRQETSRHFGSTEQTNQIPRACVCRIAAG